MHVVTCLVGILQCVKAACKPIPSFTVAFPVKAIDIHEAPRASSLAMSMHCAECGCSCSESADPATADVIVQTELRFRGPFSSYSEKDLARIAAYNPSGLYAAIESPADTAGKLYPIMRRLAFDDVFCVNGMCPPVIGNVVVYRDSNHLTRPFSHSLANVLERRLLEAAPLSGRTD